MDEGKKVEEIRFATSADAAEPFDASDDFRHKAAENEETVVPTCRFLAFPQLLDARPAKFARPDTVRQPRKLLNRNHLPIHPKAAVYNSSGCRRLNESHLQHSPFGIPHRRCIRCGAVLPCLGGEA